MNLNKEEIIKFTKIHPSRISNIYLYGSRVYGTFSQNSDYDLIVLASNPIEHQELKLYSSDGKQYNIHIYVSNKFEDNLEAHDIHCLECIWAPKFAKIQIKKEYEKTFNLNVHKLKLKLFTQSHDAWYKAKLRINAFDIYRGMKNIYHALRILIFGIQIINNGKIVDFSEGNNLYNDIINTEKYDWQYFYKKYLPMKKMLENKFAII